MKAQDKSMRWLIISLAVFSILINVFLMKDFRSGDAFISMYYGLNLYEGRYLEINPDEPSSGASSPLWMYLHALMRPLSIQFDDLYTHFIMMKWLNVFFLVLSSIILFRIMDESGTSPIVQIVAVLFWFLNPFVINWTTRCLELPLQALTCWYAIYRILLRNKDRGALQSFLDGIVFGIVLLTRYESGLLLLLLGLYGLINRRWVRPHDYVLLVCGFLLVYGYHLGFMLSEFGTIIPSTASKGNRLSHSGMEPIKHLLIFYGPFLLIFLANCINFKQISQVKQVITLWVVGHLGFVIIVLGYSHLQRYFLAVIPLVVWISLDSPLLSSVRKYLDRIPTGKFVGFVSAGFLLLAGTLFAYGHWEGSYLNRFISFQRGDLRTRTAIADYIKKNIPPDSTIAMAELDWIPLYSKCKILDVVGILYEDINEHKGDFVALLKDRKPEYLVLEENFIRSTARVNDLILFKRKLLDLLRKGNDTPTIDGMKFERVYSVPYYGSGGQLELFKGNFEYSNMERSQWQWYVLRIEYL
jgi:hypothetical protein